MASEIADRDAAVPGPSATNSCDPATGRPGDGTQPLTRYELHGVHHGLLLSRISVFDPSLGGMQASAWTAALEASVRTSFHVPARSHLLVWESGGGDLLLEDLAPEGGEEAAPAARVGEGNVVLVFDASRAFRKRSSEAKRVLARLTARGILVGVAQLGDEPIILYKDGKAYRPSVTFLNAEGVEKATQGRVRVEVLEGARVSFFFFFFLRRGRPTAEKRYHEKGRRPILLT